ncbi:MAG TPA: DUF6445 family protein [Myxococcota bacterium]|nr:DUF6445 family protein [Myxococcota bacterium]
MTAPPALAALRSLPHQRPREGRDFWVLDNVLPDPDGLRQRLLQRTDWVFGAPTRPETWPGKRAPSALSPEELAPIEQWVREKTGKKRLKVGVAPDGASLNHNCVQVVGGKEGRPLPHTDRRDLCTFAAVIYLTPGLPASCGTSFYRIRLPDGTPGGNRIPAPHKNLVEALGTRFVPGNIFMEEVRVDYRYNRMLLYPADLLHSASGYVGEREEDRRMTLLFFWLC